MHQVSSMRTDCCSRSIVAPNLSPQEFDRQDYKNYSGPEYHASGPFHRGQTLAIRYQRLKHSHPGYLRLTFVRPDHFFDPSAHERNSFYFSCNNSLLIPSPETSQDNGFSFVGSAGFLPPALGYDMYLSYVAVPQVLSDGNYVLTVLWFLEVERPFFSQSLEEVDDYQQTCELINVSGGAPLQSVQSTSMSGLMDRYSTERNLLADLEKKSITSARCSSFGYLESSSNVEAGMTTRFARKSLRSTVSKKYQKSAFDMTIQNSVDRADRLDDQACHSSFGKKPKRIFVGIAQWFKRWGSPKRQSGKRQCAHKASSEGAESTWKKHKGNDVFVVS